MKKFYFCFLVLCLMGCRNESLNTDGLDDQNNTNDIVNEVIRNDIYCTLDGSGFTLTLENGQIIRYIDDIEGELGQETIDILNNEHLVGVKSNDDALNIMAIALNDLGGSCS